jgi:hypothetical protein
MPCAGEENFLQRLHEHPGGASGCKNGRDILFLAIFRDALYHLSALPHQINKTLPRAETTPCDS